MPIKINVDNLPVEYKKLFVADGGKDKIITCRSPWHDFEEILLGMILRKNILRAIKEIFIAIHGQHRLVHQMQYLIPQFYMK